MPTATVAKKTIRDIQIAGKRVLIRVDFNVPQDETGRITDDARIRESLPTIQYAVQQGAKVILMSRSQEGCVRKYVILARLRATVKWCWCPPPAPVATPGTRRAVAEALAHDARARRLPSINDRMYVYEWQLAVGLPIFVALDVGETSVHDKIWTTVTLGPFFSQHPSPAYQVEDVLSGERYRIWDAPRLCGGWSIGAPGGFQVLRLVPAADTSTI